MNPTPCNREKSEFSRRSFVRSSAAWTIYGDIPFLTVAGNHDVRRGRHRQGEFENYRRDICAWHSRELGRRIDDITFSFMQGPDLWIVADYNRPDIELVERLLCENRDARHTVFCTHGAVLTARGADLFGRGVCANYYALDSTRPCASFSLRGC